MEKAPWNKKKKGERKKKDYAKHYRNSPSSILTKTLAPDIVYTKLKYAVGLSSTGVGASAVVRLLRGNGPFDPEFIIGGSQPVGWDQWSELYNRHCVRGSALTINARKSDTGTGAGIVYCVPNWETVTQANYEATISNPYCKRQILGSSNSESVPLTNYISTAKIFGLEPNQMGSITALCPINTSLPTREWYWDIGLSNLNGTTTTIDVDLDVEITYYIQFMERKVLSLS